MNVYASQGSLGLIVIKLFAHLIVELMLNALMASVYVTKDLLGRIAISKHVLMNAITEEFV